MWAISAFFANIILLSILSIIFADTSVDIFKYTPWSFILVAAIAITILNVVISCIGMSPTVLSTNTTPVAISAATFGSFLIVISTLLAFGAYLANVLKYDYTMLTTRKYYMGYETVCAQLRLMFL